MSLFKVGDKPTYLKLPILSHLVKQRGSSNTRIPTLEAESRSPPHCRPNIARGQFQRISSLDRALTTIIYDSSSS